MTGELTVQFGDPGQGMICVTVQSGCSEADTCIDFVVLPLDECDCDTDAGTMPLDTIELCDESCFTFSSNLDTNLIAGDIAEYILHDFAGNAIFNPIQVNNTGEFCKSGVGQPDYKYTILCFHWFVGARTMGSGSVDLTDVCHQVTAGQPVIWYEIPDASLVFQMPRAPAMDTISLRAVPSIGAGSWAVSSGPGICGFLSLLVDLQPLQSFLIADLMSFSGRKRMESVAIQSKYPLMCCAIQLLSSHRSNVTVHRQP